MRRPRRTGRHAEDSVILLVGRCHKRLRSTRGVVMSLASFDARESIMTWIGIGNVAGLLLRREGGAQLTRTPAHCRGGGAPEACSRRARVWRAERDKPAGTRC